MTVELLKGQRISQVFPALHKQICLASKRISWLIMEGGKVEAASPELWSCGWQVLGLCQAAQHGSAHGTGAALGVQGLGGQKVKGRKAGLC